MRRTCDTSVLVPALLDWHPSHQECRAVVADGIRAVPGHAQLEAYSVLTRLPPPHRLSAADAEATLDQLRLVVIALSGPGHRDLVSALARHGVSGGAVYDGLVAATAVQHDLHLVTRDRRARTTYDALGVGYTLV